MSGRLDLASWMFHVFEVMCAHLEALALRLYIVRGLGRDLLLSTRVASLSLLHGLYLSSNVLKKSFLKYDLVLFILESRKMGCHLGVAHYWVLAGLASLSLVILQDNALGL